MIPEIGHFALILALAIAVLQVTFPLLGAFKNKEDTYFLLAKPLALSQFIFILVSFLCLTYAFVTNDFSVAYVANHSNSTLPIYYQIAAVWGAHEGSLLLWVLILSGWTIAVAYYAKEIPLRLLGLILSVLGIISIGFILFILFTSNPFERILPFPPLNGADLNPLLQDFGLTIHPPMLYMGYVGFSVAFAFAIAGLIQGNIDQNWARWARPWTLVAWAFLTLGIALGSWWAYYELGWGGWWFWDPVENASLMPWLVGTALIHSLAVSQARNLFKSWTVLLAIFAFSLSLLGTFLVRSGVLTSVHAFANDPERGLFILGFLVFIVGGALLLYAWRAPRIKGNAYFAGLSRESLLLLNNVILVVACATVLLGTVYPLILDAFNLGKISVGPPYFNKLFIPMALLLGFLMALAPISSWKKSASAEGLIHRLNYLFIFSLLAAIGLPYLITGGLNLKAIAGLFIGLWIVLATADDFLRKINYRISNLSYLGRHYYSMCIAHTGLAITLIGVALTSQYSVEKDVRMSVGDSVNIGGYEFFFKDLNEVFGSNYAGARGTFIVSKDHYLKVLHPEKRVFSVSKMPMSEVALDPGIFRDLYVALAEPLDNTTWAVRIYYKPFVRWLWLGALLMMLGGLFAAKRPRRQHAMTG